MSYEVSRKMSQPGQTGSVMDYPDRWRKAASVPLTQTVLTVCEANCSDGTDCVA